MHARRKLGDALTTESYDYGTKPWAEAQLVVIAKAGMHGRPAKIHPTNPQPAITRNFALAIQAITTLARLKGWIVERKSSLTGKLDLSKLSPADLRATLSAHLDQLDPSSRAQIESIAAGEYDSEAETLD